MGSQSIHNSLNLIEKARNITRDFVCYNHNSISKSYNEDVEMVYEDIEFEGSLSPLNTQPEMLQIHYSPTSLTMQEKHKDDPLAYPQQWESTSDTSSDSDMKDQIESVPILLRIKKATPTVQYDHSE